VNDIIYEQHLYLKHKGYEGNIEWSEEDQCYYGKIQNITDLIMYEADNVFNLSGEFIKAVDDYIYLKSVSQ